MMTMMMKRIMMSWCDCLKLLTPSCCPFPRAKAEEELWTHSNEQSEVAQREAPKGPSKNKSWPWQKHREEQKTRATEADLSDEEHMLSSCKSPNRGLDRFILCFFFQMNFWSEQRNTKTEHGWTQVASHNSRVIPLAKERLFFNGDIPPSFVRLQSLLDAFMRTGLRLQAARNNKYRARPSFCFYLL